MLTTTTKLLTALLCVSALAAGCSAPQRIQIESDPSGAYIYVGGEYVGASPCTYKVDNVGAIDSLEIRARIRNLEVDGVVLHKKRNGYFPERSMLVLDDKDYLDITSAPATQPSGSPIIYNPIMVPNNNNAPNNSPNNAPNNNNFAPGGPPAFNNNDQSRTIR